MPTNLVSINDAVARIVIAKQTQHDDDVRDDVFMPREAAEQNSDRSFILKDTRKLITRKIIGT